MAIRALALGQGAHGSAGTVLEAGTPTDRLAPGDRIVIFPASLSSHALTDRELVVNEQRCLPLPASLSFEQAAAMASAHVTAWRLLMSSARLKPGEIVLIVGLSDATAVAALQIAVQFGAHAIAASDNQNHLARARALGAEQTIDWANTDLAKELRRVTDKHGADVAINCLGGESWSQTLACLARGGRLLTAGACAGSQPQTDLRRIFWNHLQVLGAACGNRDDFDETLRYMTTTQTQPIIDSAFAVDQEKAARQRFQSGAAFGSVILRISSCG